MSGSGSDFWRDLVNIFRRRSEPAVRRISQRNYVHEPFEEMNNARIHAIVQAEVERCLIPEGFEAAGILKWVRDRHRPIRHVFGLVKWKGGIIAPRWGVSLDFVPHFSGRQIRWHRTNQAAEFDLCVDSSDKSLDMTYIRGERPIREMHEQVITASARQADSLWTRCQSASELPAVLTWFKENPGPGARRFYSYSSHPIAAAFILAKNGCRDEALAELEHSHIGQFKGEAVVHKLKELIMANKA